jgi:hypothetical protein
MALQFTLLDLKQNFATKSAKAVKKYAAEEGIGMPETSDKEYLLEVLFEALEKREAEKAHYQIPVPSATTPGSPSPEIENVADGPRISIRVRGHIQKRVRAGHSFTRARQMFLRDFFAPHELEDIRQDRFLEVLEF